MLVLIIKYIHHQQFSSSSFMLSEFIFSVNKSRSSFYGDFFCFERGSMDRKVWLNHKPLNFKALNWIVLKVNLKIRRRIWSFEDVWVASESEGVIISVSILCLALSLRCQPTVNVNEFADKTIHQSNLWIQHWTRDRENKRRNDSRIRPTDNPSFKVFTF